MAKIKRLLFIVAITSYSQIGSASQGLAVFTSDNPQSNQLRSFVVVPNGLEIPQGIAAPSGKKTLQRQAPFKVEILDRIWPDQQVQWVVTIPHNRFGLIWVLSDYSGYKKINETETVWTSQLLGSQVNNRHILLFEPRRRGPDKPTVGNRPVTTVKKSGRAGNATIGNPRLKYLVEARVLGSDGSLVNNYFTSLEMDDKDLIRQEYIDRFRVSNTGSSSVAGLTVPTRDEIQVIPERPKGLSGGQFPGNKHDLVMDDGALDLANRVLDEFERMKTFYRIPGNELRDLDGKPLTIPERRLWLSSGWRIPERNDWNREAFNGANHLGIAFDILPNGVHRIKDAAVIYWVLWEAIKSLPDQHKYFAQLEAVAISSRLGNFKVDVEPRNGIPDAFDTADYLHIKRMHE